MEPDVAPQAPGWEQLAAALREQVMSVNPTDGNAARPESGSFREQLMSMLHYDSIEAEMQVRDDMPRLLQLVARAAGVAVDP